jgi:hypothetical protein
MKKHENLKEVVQAFCSKNKITNSKVKERFLTILEEQLDKKLDEVN